MYSRHTSRGSVWNERLSKTIDGFEEPLFKKRNAHRVDETAVTPKKKFSNIVLSATKMTPTKASSKANQKYNTSKNERKKQILLVEIY